MKAFSYIHNIITRFLLTGSDSTHRRLRVDVAQTGFFTGREFRSFFERVDLAQGQSATIKFVSPVNFILFEQVLVVEDGSIRFTPTTGASESTAFETVVPIFGKNRMSDRPTPHYEPVVTLTTGGTITGGVVVDITRLRTANSTSTRETITGNIADERGLPAGTYYLQFTNNGSGNATFTYSLFWEERP